MKKIPGAYILMYIAFLLAVASLFASCATNGYGCKGRSKIITRVRQ
jgi:hypothetical protein